MKDAQIQYWYLFSIPVGLGTNWSPFCFLLHLTSTAAGGVDIHYLQFVSEDLEAREGM